MPLHWLDAEELGWTDLLAWLALDDPTSIETCTCIAIRRSGGGRHSCSRPHPFLSSENGNPEARPWRAEVTSECNREECSLDQASGSSLNEGISGSECFHPCHVLSWARGRIDWSPASCSSPVRLYMRTKWPGGHNRVALKIFGRLYQSAGLSVMS
ncbi:uncharacterized protein BO72DRAFT_293998 [Aspergillus fijiensis CBS 313.89]|uniref:Uncharacterized protein n=1 Tax=Aspergillus fijiensis CBS 313.89 TaxID=1448319 RepID=A0A8G1VUE1_9EURO|nr:uncharacterized protein BO72DRAFT_293998 [Aspergillus fijiensis CBS 313.89]RAK72033.1 hypothetical protein BO72DRAFT_293998 [Aspergillus fijiensis CBS 313.89]